MELQYHCRADLRMKRPEKLIVTEFKSWGEGGDCGRWVEIQCPECQDTVCLAEYGWWDTHCQCGRDWSLLVVGTRGGE